MTMTKIPPTVPRQPTVAQIMEHIRERGGWISRDKALCRLTVTAMNTDPLSSVVAWSWFVDDVGRIVWNTVPISYDAARLPSMFDLGPNPDPNQWQFSEVTGTYT